MEPVYTVYTVYTKYYHNARIKSTKIQALCTLKTPFNIVFDAHSTAVVTQFNLYKNVCFYKYGHDSGPRGSPDMILTVFDVKFHEKQK